MANPKMVVCGVFNKVYNSVELCYTAPTVGLIIRDNSPMLYRVNPHFQEDYELREIGSFDENCQFVPLMKDGHPTYNVHSWDEYKSPEQNIAKVNPDVKK